MKPTFMLIGLGNLGSRVLELLACEKGIGRIIVCSRNEAAGKAFCNLAAVGAAARNILPSLVFQPLDLNNVESVADVVKKVKPDIILNTATMQSWWLPDLLPPEQAALIKSAGFGVWLPVHMALALKLMRSLHEAGFKGISLSAPYPDVVNCVLGRLGIAPTSGVGNIDEIVAKIQLLAAGRLKAEISKVKVILVAHHALESAAYGSSRQEIPPYFLRIVHDGQEVTEAVQGDRMLLLPFPLPPGPAIHVLTASTILRLVRGLLSEEEVFLHAPGPHGLPGGYPILASRRGLRLAPVDGLTLEEARRINENSHRFDGINRIEEDGTVVFSAESSEVLRLALGYDCRLLRPSETEERAVELIERFREYAGRWGVKL